MGLAPWTRVRCNPCVCVVPTMVGRLHCYYRNEFLGGCRHEITVIDHGIRSGNGRYVSDRRRPAGYEHSSVERAAGSRGPIAGFDPAGKHDHDHNDHDPADDLGSIASDHRELGIRANLVHERHDR